MKTFLLCVWFKRFVYPFWILSKILENTFDRRQFLYRWRHGDFYGMHISQPIYVTEHYLSYNSFLFFSDILVAYHYNAEQHEETLLHFSDNLPLGMLQNFCLQAFTNLWYSWNHTWGHKTGKPISERRVCSCLRPTLLTGGEEKRLVEHIA